MERGIEYVAGKGGMFGAFAGRSQRRDYPPRVVTRYRSRRTGTEAEVDTVSTAVHCQSTINPYHHTRNHPATGVSNGNQVIFYGFSPWYRHMC